MSSIDPTFNQHIVENRTPIFLNKIYSVLKSIPRGILSHFGRPDVQSAITYGVTTAFIIIGAHTATKLYPENLLIMLSLAILNPKMTAVTCYALGVMQLMNTMKN